jgi:hypothetical protein
MTDSLPEVFTRRPASERALLDQLRTMLTRADLADISTADYGNDRQQHFAALDKICSTATVDSNLPWHPGEVLELTRWSRPENPEWKPGTQGRPGHLQRAFACAVLLRQDNVFITGEEQETLAPLIESCLELGGDSLPALEAFILWRIAYLCGLPEYSRDDDTHLQVVFYALGFLIAQAHNPPKAAVLGQSELQRRAIDRGFAVSAFRSCV